MIPTRTMARLPGNGKARQPILKSLTHTTQLTHLCLSSVIEMLSYPKRYSSALETHLSMPDHRSKGTDPDNASVTQLQHELIEAKRRYLTLYALCENSVATTEKLHHRCTQVEAKLKVMLGMFLFSVLINGILLGICLHITPKAPEQPPTFYVPEHMMPNIHQIA